MTIRVGYFVDSSLQICLVEVSINGEICRIIAVTVVSGAQKLRVQGEC